MMIPTALLDFLRWIDASVRTYDETMEAWQTSCPRFSTWEDATIDGLVAMTGSGKDRTVVLTDAGRALLGSTQRPASLLLKRSE
jgi:hypothetical protein